MEPTERILEIIKDPLGDVSELTPREGEVVRLVARGYYIREIAEQLEISTNTVTWHLSQIKEKTGLSKAGIIRHLVDRIELVLIG